MTRNVPPDVPGGQPRIEIEPSAGVVTDSDRDRPSGVESSDRIGRRCSGSEPACGGREQGDELLQHPSHAHGIPYPAIVTRLPIYLANNTSENGTFVSAL
jgi:hypothetical protein